MASDTALLPEHADKTQFSPVLDYVPSLSNFGPELRHTASTASIRAISGCGARYFMCQSTETPRSLVSVADNAPATQWREENPWTELDDCGSLSVPARLELQLGVNYTTDIAFDAIKCEHGLSDEPAKCSIPATASHPPISGQNARLFLSQDPLEPATRRYNCTMCSKVFNQQAHLRAHERVHTGERPYACDLCESRFTQATHLRSHRRIHTGEKPHSCPKCDKRFSRAYHVTLHLATHTGEKRMHCDVCGKSFRQTAHLRRHERIHGIKSRTASAVQPVSLKRPRLEEQCAVV